MPQPVGIIDLVVVAIHPCVPLQATRSAVDLRKLQRPVFTAGGPHFLTKDGDETGLLRHYREQAGAAGALFGLSYYLLLGMMLGVAGTVQQLGLVLSVCALLAWICSLRRG